VITEWDVNRIRYISAWNTHEHGECSRILMMESVLGMRPFPPRSGIRWVNPDQLDYEEEAMAQGVSLRELIGGG
jgi:hypothetical protein